MEKIKQRAEAGEAGEPGRAAVFNRTVGEGLLIPTGSGSQCKGPEA